MQEPDEQQGGQVPAGAYQAAAAGHLGVGWGHGEPGVMPPEAWALQGSGEWAQQQAWGVGAQAWGYPGQPPQQAIPGGYAMAQHMPYHPGFSMPTPGAGMGQLQQCQGGVIFLCDPRTEEECLQRGLFGLPATQTQIVRAIVPEATLLFLFNVRVRQMLGVFRATCWPQQNLEPQAWAEDGSAGGSRFPLQVRVRLDTPTVLMLSEDRVRAALEYRGSLNRFDLQMSKESALALAQLFHAVGEPRPPQQLVPMSSLGQLGSRDSGDNSGSGSGRGGDRTERSRRNGLVFICDPTTEAECLQRRLLGLPKSQSSLLSKLADTSLLFLFNVRTRMMLGVFAPDGPAGLEIEPSAFGGGGRFPVQVRFQPVHPSGHVLSVPEAALGEVLRYRNASTRFDLLLRGRAVDKIVGIFSHRGTPMGGVGLGPSAGLGMVGALPLSGAAYAEAQQQLAAGQQPPLPPQQPPLPPQPPPPLQEQLARRQPPLPPQPPPALPPLPPETATSGGYAGHRQMPPLPPMPPPEADTAISAAAPPSEVAATKAAAAESTAAAAAAVDVSEAAAPLPAMLESLSIASSGATPAAESSTQG
jgi:hypothetical protein